MDRYDHRAGGWVPLLANVAPKQGAKDDADALAFVVPIPQRGDHSVKIGDAKIGDLAVDSLFSFGKGIKILLYPPSCSSL